MTKVEKIDDLPDEDKWLVNKTDIDHSDDEEEEDLDNTSVNKHIAELHGDDTSDEEESGLPVKKKIKLENT